MVSFNQPKPKGPKGPLNKNQVFNGYGDFACWYMTLIILCWLAMLVSGCAVLAKILLSYYN